MAEIGSLEIKIESDAGKANRAIDSIIKNLGKLSNALNMDTSGLANIGKALRFDGAEKAVKKMQLQAQSIKPNVDFKITGLENTENQISNISEKLRTVSIPQNAFNYNAEAMKAVFGEMASGIENWSQATQNFGANAGAVFNQTSSKTDELKSRTEQFEQSLKNLQIPPINTDNINVLQRELAKSEANLEKLRVKLANGIAMGRISANVDDKGFRNLKEQMSLAEKQGEALREKIKQIQETSGKTSSGAKKLGNSVGSAARSFLGLANSSAKAIKPLNNLGNSFRSLLRVILPILGIRQLFNWGKQAIEASSDLTEVQNVVDVSFANMAHKVEEFAKTSIEQFGLSELALKQYSSRFQSMGAAMGISSSLIGNANDNLYKLTDGYISASDSMADMSLNLTKLTADMASFYNVEQDVVAEKLASVFTGQTRPLRDFGLDLTQATLQEWALKQGIDANIQSMSQAEKTMLRYQYVLANTEAVHNDFVRTSGSWANQVRILSQNFQQLAGIVGGVLVNAFKPVIAAANAAMSAIIAFAKTISNALGKIFGWTYEEGGGGIAGDFGGAADAAEDLAGSTGKAADNVEKIKKGIRSFDELKTIELPEPSGGSGGGGGGGGGAGGAGEAGGGWVKGESILKQFESEIDNLYDLGKYIGDKLTEAMNRINWDSVYEKARNFGSGLADFLNGLISPELFGAVGRTIAGALNTAIYAALSFGETFDWENLGTSIAAGINEFFETFDFASLANTIDAWVQGIWNTTKTAILNVNWKNIWNGAKEFLENIDLETISIIVGALTIKKILGMHLASTALSFIGTTLSQKIAQAIASKLGVTIASNAGIGTALATGLKATFASVSGLGIFDIGTVLGAGTLAEKIAFISKMIGGIALVIGGAVTAVKNFFDMWENGFNWLGETLMVIGVALAAVGTVILGAPALVTAAVAGIVAAVATAVVLIKENWDGITDFFGGIFENVKKISSQKLGEFLNLLSEIPGKVSGIIDNIASWFSQLPERIGYGLGYALGTVTKWGVDLYSYLSEKIPEIVENVKTWFAQLPDKIYAAISTAISKIASWGAETLETFKIQTENIISNVVTWFSEVPQKIYEAIIMIRDKIAEWASNTISFFQEEIPKIIDKVVEFFSTLPEKITEVGEDLVTGLWNGIQSKVNWLGTNIKGFVNGVIQGFKEGFDEHSPSKIAFGIGDFFTIGLGEGITNGFDGVYKDIINFGKEISNIEISPSQYTMPLLDMDFRKNRSLESEVSSVSATLQADISASMASRESELREQNRLLQEQNELLRMIYEKPTLSDDDVFNSTRRGQQKYQSRTWKTGWAGVD